MRYPPCYFWSRFVSLFSFSPPYPYISTWESKQECVGVSGSVWEWVWKSTGEWQTPVVFPRATPWNITMQCLQFIRHACSSFFLAERLILNFTSNNPTGCLHAPKFPVYSHFVLPVLVWLRFVWIVNPQVSACTQGVFLIWECFPSERQVLCEIGNCCWWAVRSCMRWR